MKHPIGQTRNGVAVYVDLINSRAATNIAAQPHLLTLVTEAIQQVLAESAETRVACDMGRVIGYDSVVTTTDKHFVLYAKVVGETIYTRFVKNGRPLTTQHLTLVLRRDNDNEYELHDTWIGQIIPPRPGSAKENRSSRTYWDTHAYILNAQQLQLKTVTKVCPY